MKLLLFFILLRGAFLSDQESFIIHEQIPNEVQLGEHTTIAYSSDTLALWLPDSVFNAIHNQADDFKAARVSIRNNTTKDLKYVLKTGGRDKVYGFFESERVSYADTTGWLSENFYRQLNNEKNYENRLLVTLAPQEDLRVTLLYHITRGRGPTSNVSIVPYKDYLLLLNQRKSVDNYQQGIFQGLVAILFIINFFYFFLTRDSAYLAYSLYNFFIWAYTSSLYGYLYLAFLDYDPILKYLADNIFLLASILFYFMFLRKFVNTKERYPVWHNITIFLTYTIYALLAITSVLIYFYQAAYLPYDIRNMVILLCLVLAIVFIIQLLVSGDLRDRLFATGTSALIIFAFISIGTYFMRENFSSDKILQIGIVIELSLFSIALADRKSTRLNSSHYS